MQALNLDALTGRKHTISKGDVVHEVEPVTTRMLTMIDAADAQEGVARLQGYCDVVALILPSMAREDIESLSIPQLLAVVKLASAQVAAVEEAASDPNVPSSAPVMTTPATEPTAEPPAAT